MAARTPAKVRQLLRFVTASGTLQAAASKITLSSKGKINKPEPERWQSDAWDMVDLIPEVSQAATFLSNVVSGVQMYVALRPDDTNEPPAPAPAGTMGAESAWDLLDRLRTGSVHGGLGGLLYSSVFNLKVPGEFYLLGEPPVAGDPFARPDPIPARDERWDVRSIDEIEVKGKLVTIKDRPGDKGRVVRIGDETTDDPEAVFLLRVWDRHPRYSALARSSLRAALNQCDELLLLGKCVRVAARRFLAGNGMLAIPSEMDLPGSPDQGDEGEDPTLSPLMRKLGTAMVASMADESNPDSLVPLMTMAPGDLLQKLQHITFYGALDAEMRELALWIQARLGAGLDLPIEQLTGIAKVNHWGAWQIDSASWARYGQPTTRLIVDSWTEGLLWPMLEDNYGVPKEAARRLMFWFDPADAIMDPDEGKTADELHDRFVISDEAYRRRKGASEDEAPTPEEIEDRIRRRTRPTTPGEPLPSDGEASTTAALVSSNGNGYHAPRQAPMTAAARSGAPLGRRLMEIDRTLRTRLEEAAEAALRRGLSAAGARLRSRALANSNLTAAVKGVPNHLVASRLGPTVTATILAAAEMSEDDLLVEAVEDMAPRWEKLTAKVQRQTRQTLASEFDLTDDDLAELEVRQDRERNEAWLWLSAALLTLARARLHDPTPAAPALGEFDTASSVPTALLREAMSRAGGGAPGVDTAAGPAGGVATGVDVMALWAENGMVVGGWEWVHGDPVRDFPAHAALDGVQFATWDDPVLTVAPEDAWLGVPFYRPGDHDWCSCSFFALSVSESADQTEPAMA